MKRAFTLLELLITVGVLVIMMGLVFRLSSIGSDSTARAVTVRRMQCLENCLSGYYAAFGNYPPVKKHGSQDIFREVDDHGIQTENTNKNLWNWSSIGDSNEQKAWNQVKSACLAQPVACRYPFPDGLSELAESVSEEMKDRAESGDDEYSAYWSNESIKRRLVAGFDDGVSKNIGRFGSYKNETDWTQLQLFKFGVMSFLLPRYLVMMNGDQVFFNDYAQWTGNNEIPSNPFTGDQYSSWTQVRKYSTSSSQSDLAKVANIPSQAVCARWMPNLSGICSVGHGTMTLFGVVISDDSGSILSADNPYIEIFSPGSSDSTANQYVLDGVSVTDGWGNEFYYYSPEPYQRYTLWSAGANGRTFPPWVDRNSSELGGSANDCISKWVQDDIIHLSN